MHENGHPIGEMLTQAIQALERAAEAPADAVFQGDGVAADGQVRVVAGPDGRLRELHLNPRVMRMASEDLAREILGAVNAALDDLRAHVPGLEGVDPQLLARTMGGAHAGVMGRLEEFADGVELVVRRLEER
ncbi:YbaB/EbfC family nucleoid-associated protein [Nonomuraea endophytica]|uniref:DNA-binding protein YbaB n=1 Tax=Nonomuraea endophytica TaxID=714136 RepID=A0A7W8AF48_9ACTN|nr:YbaB/EbfC family nucleoid-associated protein [Nonomuraea endophytica]MBB5085019.1 DNA-binding protein YbaB [Nonomuraea endophytica]